MGEISYIALKPVLKTQIMYRANLSFSQLNEYLSLMIDLGLLEAIQDKEGNRTAYRTTKKGLRYLTAYNEVRKLRGQKPIGEVALIQKRKSEQR
jgi:predicted transcriptional regulator